jgi:hypothetical protein
MIMPVTLSYVKSDYVLRVDPDRRAEVLASVDATLVKVDRSRVLLDRVMFPEIRKNHF